jgi:hypothetical protein
MTELTEYQTIDTAIPVPVYPDEFTLILRALNYALDYGNLSTEEEERLQRFKDDFADLALENAI